MKSWAVIPLVLAISSTVMSDMTCPVLTLLKLSRPPVIDGVLTPGEWDRAVGVTDFVRYLDDKIALNRGRLECYLGYTDDKLYVAFRRRLAGETLVSGVKSRDGVVWADDSVELFLVPPDQDRVYHIVGNSAGVFWDGNGPKSDDPTWNGKWEFVNHVANGVWTGEIAIDFSELGMKSPPTTGAAWRFNFCWNIMSGTPEFAEWAYTPGNFHDRDHYAHLIFGGGPVVSRATMQVQAGGAELVGRLEAVGDDKPVQVTVRAAGAVTEVPVKGPEFRVALPKPLKGRIPAAVVVTHDGRPIYAQQAIFEVQDPFETTTRVYPVRGELVVEWNPQTLRGAGGLTIQLDASRRELTESELKTTREVRFDIRKLCGQSVALQLQSRGADGQPLQQADITITIPPVPDWAEYDEPMPEVPDPWTPVIAKKDRVAVWGREYNFAGGLPGQIRILEEDALAAPAALELTLADGTTGVVPLKLDRTLDRRKGLVRAAYAGKVGTVRVEAVLATEFDGFIRADIHLRAPYPVEVTSLKYVLPLKRTFATHLYVPPNSWVVDTGLIPADDLRGPFNWLIWLGNPRAGVAWMAESPKGCRLKEPANAIEIRRTEQATTLTVNFINTPTRLTKWEYTFALQATPVKPIDPEWRRACRIVGSAPYWADLDKNSAVPSVLTHSDFDVFKQTQRPVSFTKEIKDAGAVGWNKHEEWTELQNYGETRLYQKELKHYIDSCHTNGLTASVYFGFQISDQSPTWPYRDEVLVLPRDIGYRRQQVPQTCYAVCYGSYYGNFLLHQMRKLKEQYHLDGVYLDGTIFPETCANEAHGCGYRDESDALHPTVNLFRKREFMKKMYCLWHTGADRTVRLCAHNGTVPTIGFVDCAFWGEYWTAGDATIPLDRYRIEFTGRPWGVPGALFGHEMEYAVRIAVLHDGFTWLTWPSVVPLMKPIWDAFDEFGYPYTFTGYYEIGDMVRCSDPNIKVSVYRNAKHHALLAIMNLGPKTTEAAIRLNAESLIQKDKVTEIRDMLSGSVETPAEPNNLHLRMSPSAFRFLKVR